MIELFRRRDCRLGKEIEGKLRDLVVAHRVVIVESKERRQGTPERLPAVREGSRLITRQQALAEYLRELERDVRDWNRFQSDACYLDEDGDSC